MLLNLYFIASILLFPILDLQLESAPAWKHHNILYMPSLAKKDNFSVENERSNAGTPY